ncbi:MAG: dihydropteroate synthase [Lachnospiraceae bacterium]
MKIGNREFNTEKHTYVMGILNITPDSFSDGGRYNRLNEALYHVEQMIHEGMDILDIGGESTRPGYQLLEDEEEIARVIPVIEAVKHRFDIPISLDTYKSAVAAEGIRVGIDLVNDIWGLRYHNNMAEVIAQSGLPCCLMHNRKKAEYTSFMQEVAADLSETLYLADKAGISRDKIILDPGVGFAKSYEQNLQIINHLELFHALDCPILLGASRKSVIGLTLETPIDDRLEGTLATTVLAVVKHCAFIRVHDILPNVRCIRMTEAILNQD